MGRISENNAAKELYLRRFNNRVEHALNVVGAHMVGKAAHYCPVKTSNLVNSLNYATSKEQGALHGSKTNGTPLEKAIEDKTAKIGTNVKYAARVEFGFSGQDSLGRSFNQPGTPFLRAAFLSHKSDIGKIFAQAMKDYDVSMS